MKIEFTRILLLGAATTACLGCGTTIAYAQESAAAAGETAQDDGLGEILVTARRTSERLQDVPVAVTAVGGEQLEALGIVQGQDLQRIAPSLTISPTVRGSASPQYGIRAQRAGTPTILIDPAVGVYFAEVGTSRAGGGNAVLHDLASVQILRGPQGTLFGRNTTGGAVLITPAAPTGDFAGYVQGQAGNLGLIDLEGMLNLPIGPTLSLRAAAKMTKRDGYTYNVLQNQRTDDIDSQSYRLSLRWAPNDVIESTTIGTYLRVRENGTGLKLGAVDTTVLAGVTAPLGPLLVADFNSQPRDFYSYNGAIALRNNQDIYGIQNITSIDLGGGFGVKNIIGYKDFKNDYCFNTAGSAVHVVAPCGTQTTEQFSDELQFTFSSDRIDLIGGLFYFRESGNDSNIQTQLAALAGINPANSPPPANRGFQDFDAVNTSYSLFFHAEVEAAEWLSFAGGIRFTHDDREVTWHNIDEVRVPAGTNNRVFRCRLSSVTNGSLDNTTPDRNLCSYSASTSFEEPTWDVSVKFKASDKMQAYFAHRHGYRSGGFPTSPNNVAVSSPFLPEKIDDIEFGLKTEFDLLGGPARFNAAAYYGWYTNIQRSTSGAVQLAPPPAAPVLVGLTTNASQGDIYGAELEFEWRPATNLDIRLNYARTETDYTRYTDIYAVAGVPTVVDISDIDFTFAPKHQFNGSLTYRLPVAESVGEPSITVSQYVQSSFGTSDTATANCGPNGLYRPCLTRNSRLPGYALTGIRAEWKRVMGSDVDLAVFVNNLFDKQYKTFSTNLQNVFGVRGDAVGAPRTAGFSLRYSFGASAD
ncbi:TonB-dependent receptor [Novosphingobium sp. BL-52-GroH]|uniref:TonB-dependent receptor n=1 Tax=Novosphingobium sp. BL-52-GroH TaxID=3349877 RepID=UPI003850C946